MTSPLSNETDLGSADPGSGDPGDATLVPPELDGASRLSARWRVGLLVAFGLLCAAALAALYLGAVRTSAGQRVDEAAIVGRSGDEIVQLTSTKTLDTISVTSLAVAVAVFLLLAVTRRRPRLAIGVAVMIVGANLTTQVLKSDLLDRPNLLNRPGAATVPSFPSGHATVAMSLALALVVVVPARLRVMAGVIGFGYAVAVGAATLTAGWHRPSDVIGAFLVATVWATVVLALVLALVLATRGIGTPGPSEFFGGTLSSRRLLVLGLALLVGAVLVTGTVVVVLEDVDWGTGNLGPAYVGAVAAMAGVALVILGVLLWILREARLDPPFDQRRPGSLPVKVADPLQPSGPE